MQLRTFCALIDFVVVATSHDTLIERLGMPALLPRPDQRAVESASSPFGGHQLLPSTEPCTMLLAFVECVEPIDTRCTATKVQVGVPTDAVLWHERPAELSASQRRIGLERRRRRLRRRRRGRRRRRRRRRGRRRGWGWWRYWGIHFLSFLLPKFVT